MSRLLATILSVRGDARLLKLPPYISFLCILVGVIWLLLLPLDEYSRRTYISENALLPGQVHTYFGGSEKNVFRAFKHEIQEVASKDNHQINDCLEGILKGAGLKTGRQNYTYHSAGHEYSGENIYGILQAPRGDATEAIVLLAAWKSISEELNENGVALALTLARYFKRWSLWSKDIILVIPPDSKTGTQAWADAYHDAHDPARVASLPIKSGALQGALAIDYPINHNFEAIHIVYDSTNGQLPNLDLINSIVNIAGNQLGLHTSIQMMMKHNSGYRDRLQTMLRGMANQGLGVAAGPHSSFIPYHVDAVTLQPYGEGWHEEMAVGRLVEGTFRCLNNLLEHLHQSFFFYLLMQKDRFVSIGTYLPSAMLLAANFTIMAIALWVQSGQPYHSAKALNSSPSDGKGKAAQATKASSTAETNLADDVETVSSTVERDLLLPLGVVAVCHGLSAVPLSIFNRLPANMLFPAFVVFTLASAILPATISQALNSFYSLKAQHFELTKSFSLLLLGMSLSTLATLNFSLAFIIGLLASPLTFIKPSTSPALKWLFVSILHLSAPPMVIYTASQMWEVDVTDVLVEASFGWNVWGMYTPVIVWCIWWPAWLVGSINALGTQTN